MTIKQFADLCGCNPQTLRYYDRVDLLKPVRVDRWTGYRYYDEEQAVAFVKIKNLQRAGFTIGEVKALLDQDNLAVRKAFDAKIAEEERRLEEIKEIRRSYQSEMDEIREKISKAREMISQAMERYDPQEEFGVGAEEYGRMVSDVSALFEKIDTSIPDGLDLDFDENQNRRDFMNDPDYGIVYEKHGWRNVKEFLNEFCELQDGGEYALLFRVDEAKYADSMAIANVALMLLLSRNPGKKKSLNCEVLASDDGLNHFWLLKKK
ncbi:MAG: MerR family transcriptional regulator [Clostridia bacterium]|nr:MerR family transcriptional regulator [Clostridia bacterium]